MSVWASSVEDGLIAEQQVEQVARASHVAPDRQIPACPTRYGRLPCFTVAVVAGP